MHPTVNRRGHITPLVTTLRDVVQLRDEYSIVITLPITWSPRDRRNKPSPCTNGRVLVPEGHKLRPPGTSALHQ